MTYLNSGRTTVVNRIVDRPEDVIEIIKNNLINEINDQNKICRDIIANYKFRFIEKLIRCINMEKHIKK